MNTKGLTLGLTRAPEANEVLPATRLLAALIVPFLVAAAAILLIAPGETERLFAWPVAPPLTAMVLGCAYLSGIVFFLRVLFSNDWSSVAAGFPAVVCFATLLGVATVLHWDRFTHDHVAFWTWAALYFTTPVLVAAAWLANAQAARSEGDEPRLEPVVKAFLALFAAGAAVVAAMLFLAPNTAADVWPWQLSELTARVLAATFVLPAILTAAVLWDSRWRAMLVPFEALAIGLAAILISALRSLADLDDSPVAWALVLGLAVLLAITLAVYATGRRRVREGASGG